jgi:tetratricopeptide (TPR) repeat protein
MAKYCVIPFILLLIFFSSCSINYLKACYENISAIYLSERGEVDRAIAVFGRALDNLTNKHKKYIEFNIAFLYREIGELDAAESKLLYIITDNVELRYRIYCELGIIAFQKGYYEKAAGFFRNAVLINNNDVRLIQNLELALLFMNDNRNQESVKHFLLTDDTGLAEDAEKLLNIMFSGENLLWIQDATETTSSDRARDW